MLQNTRRELEYPFKIVLAIRSACVKIYQTLFNFSGIKSMSDHSVTIGIGNVHIFVANGSAGHIVFYEMYN